MQASFQCSIHPWTMSPYRGCGTISCPIGDVHVDTQKVIPVRLPSKFPIRREGDNDSWFRITATLAAGYTPGTSFTGAACNCRRSFAVNANLLSWATLIKHCLKRKHESNRTEYQSWAVASAQPWCCQISVNQIWMVSWHLVGLSWRLKPAQNWILQSSHLPICLLHYAIVFRKILDAQSQSLETRDNVAIFGNYYDSKCCKIYLRNSQQQNFTFRQSKSLFAHLWMVDGQSGGTRTPLIMNNRKQDATKTRLKWICNNKYMQMQTCIPLWKSTNNMWWLSSGTCSSSCRRCSIVTTYYKIWWSFHKVPYHLC